MMTETSLYRVHAILPSWITASGKDTVAAITEPLPREECEAIAAKITMETRIEEAGDE